MTPNASISMPNILPEQKVFAIVLTGEFNPAIFHPAWLAQNELVAVEEAETAEDLICSNDVSTFVLDDAHFQVERHRFGLTTKDESKAPWIRDLAVGVFTLLEHTPLLALGLNLDIRYSLGSEESWHAVGDKLAPKPCWEGIIEDPGMLSVAVRGNRAGSAADRVDVRVQPVASPAYGVFVGINQHYDLKTESRESVFDRNQVAINILNNEWKPFLSYAGTASVQLLEKAIAMEGNE